MAEAETLETTQFLAFNLEEEDFYGTYRLGSERMSAFKEIRTASRPLKS